ncbi:MAG: hypothetical protein JRJ77_00710 [Deltaproteobacteria bacterium]|nr:hypothetical protein [Deltaproteobacteria bacterium]MBW2339050.1 hypothetical protein [Deltaproteobacteria bacterium]
MLIVRRRGRWFPRKAARVKQSEKKWPKKSWLKRRKIDAEGNRWRKAYFGGGEHFENWLAQCRELGGVMVEEVDSAGYKCFEEGGEKLYRIWIRLDPGKEDDLF